MNYGMWCLTSDVDGSRLAGAGPKEKAQADYHEYLRYNPGAEGSIFIENIDTGDQECWNPHTKNWDEL